VQFNLNGLHNIAVHISGFRGEGGRIVELNAVSVVDTVFSYGRLVWNTISTMDTTFSSAILPSLPTRYMDLIVEEAIEIKLYPYNINREGGFCLSKSWKPLIGSL
jgi:hypothetical protein